MSRENVRGIVENAKDERAEPPRPLMRQLPPADPFPVDALGTVLAPAARAINDRMRAPLAICGQSVLAAATLAVQGLANVRLPTNHEKPLSNYFVSVAATGERKSATAALAIWQSATPAGGSLVESYLASRGLHLPPVPTLRFHAGQKHPSGGIWPAMVALLTRGHDGKIPDALPVYPEIPGSKERDGASEVAAAAIAANRREHAEKKAARAPTAGAASIRILNFPELPPHGDLTDYLAGGRIVDRKAAVP